MSHLILIENMAYGLGIKVFPVPVCSRRSRDPTGKNPHVGLTWDSLFLKFMYIC